MAYIPLLITNTQHHNNLLELLYNISDELGLSFHAEKGYNSKYIDVSLLRKNKPIATPENRSMFEKVFIPSKEVALLYKVTLHQIDPAKEITPDMYESEESYKKGLKNYRDHVINIIERKL